MENKEKKNFPVQLDGQEYWVSRSVAVTMGVFRWMNGKLHVLANKRGKGTPDFQGYWNLPCGYLEYNETSQGACSRELAEETGCQVLSELDWRLQGIVTNPNDNPRQNVVLRYVLAPTATLYIPETLILPQQMDVKNRVNGGEDNEVEEIRWIDVDTIDEYEWAFNHKELIPQLKEFFNNLILLNVQVR